MTMLTLALAGTIVLASAVIPGPVPGTFLGPTTIHAPYVHPTAPGWEVTSLLTVGESAERGFYPMVGIPDGLGAIGGRWEDAPRWLNEWGGFYVDDRSYMTVFMNHELGGTAGAVRRHGQTGAFVSQWTIHLDSLRVVEGEDLIQNVLLWDAINERHFIGNTLPAGQLGRLCSADLPPASSLFNWFTWRGFFGRIFLSGEEAGNEGRAFAHVVSGPDKGNSYQLPSLGRMSYENIVTHPFTGDRTLIVNLDDSTPGQVYVYLGHKQRQGSPVERAGLVGGRLFGLRVTNGGAPYANGPAAFEDKGALSGTFSLVDVSDVAEGTGAALQTTSRDRGVTEFARPEDGAWDTRRSNVFYFVTTGASVNGASQTSRLYKLTFDSIFNPTGGTIELVADASTLTGTDGQAARSFDNMTVDEDGHVVVQEDPGNSSYIAKTWRIRPTSPATAVQVLESDRLRFISGAPNFLTQDEESSGIIEVTDLVKHARWYERGRRYFLAVMQAHYPQPGALVEGGQLYLIASARR
jgi:hypothetical protein